MQEENKPTGDETGEKQPARKYGRNSPDRLAFLRGEITFSEYIQRQKMQDPPAKVYVHIPRRRLLAKRPKLPKMPKVPNNPRRLAMLRMIAKGKTLQEVGDRFGITRERVRQIVGNISELREAEKAFEAHSEEIQRLHAEGKPVSELSSQFNVPEIVIKGKLNIKRRYQRGAPLVHGTVNGYQTHGCRCDECRAANNTENREYRRKKRAEERRWREENFPPKVPKAPRVPKAPKPDTPKES